MNRFIKNEKAFTIAELLIVIVVIAILAAITVVAYNGIQQRARDNVRKSDVAQIAKALELYNIDKGDYATAGCGNGSGNGWYNYNYSGSVSTNNCLKNAGYTQTDIVDPTGTINCILGADCYAYMKYSCGGGTYVYANLETLPHTNAATDGTCAPSIDESYGINYFVKVN